MSDLEFFCRGCQQHKKVSALHAKSSTGKPYCKACFERLQANVNPKALAGITINGEITRFTHEHVKRAKQRKARKDFAAGYVHPSWVV